MTATPGQAETNHISPRTRWAGKMLPFLISKKNCYIWATNPEDSNYQDYFFLGKLVAVRVFIKSSVWCIS